MLSKIEPDVTYDAGPTGCGELIMNLFLSMRKMEKSQIIMVSSYDPGAREDIPAWCRLQKHTLLGIDKKEKVWNYFIQKKS